MRIVCPECGSTESRGRFGAQRVCGECGTRFTPPTSLWERLTLSLVFLVPALVFGGVAVGLVLLSLFVRAPQGGGIFLGFGCGTGVVSLICLFQGVRELFGGGKVSSGRHTEVSPSKLPEVELPPFVLPCSPPVVPQEEAEADDD